MAELQTTILDLARPVAAGLDADLVDVVVKGGRGSRVVRLVADAEQGLDIDRIAELSRQVGALLDEQDLIDGAYTLEVTSPGVDRPLRSARDFRRNIGRQVRIQRTQQAAADRPGEVTGEVTAVDDDHVTLRTRRDTVVLGLDEIDHGKVQLPW